MVIESFVIRDAVESDLDDVLEIYNASIRTTTTWAERPQTLDERQAWFDTRQRSGDAVLVADVTREDSSLPEVGWKFGRWLDLVLLQRSL